MEGLRTKQAFFRGAAIVIESCHQHSTNSKILAPDQPVLLQKSIGAQGCTVVQHGYGSRC